MKKTYAVRMSIFHEVLGQNDYGPTNAGKCGVCFAGSVMARTLKCNPNEDSIPTDFDRATSKKLYALDSFRTGNLRKAFEHLEITLPAFVKLPDDYAIEGYSVDPMRFKSDMTKLAKDLASMGH